MQVNEKGLQIVREALNVFRSDMDRVTQKQKEHIEQLIEGARNIVNKKQKEILELESRVKQLVAEIDAISANSEDNEDTERMLAQKRYELEDTRRLLNRKKDELEHLKIAEKKLESSFNRLLELSVSFKQSVIDKSSDTLSSLDKCMNYIKEYTNA